MTGYSSNTYTAPIDLSHLDPHEPAAHLRYAFLGRVSTRDQQDPATSIPGQLARARTALPPGDDFIAWYWDVESGALPLDQRGQGDYTGIDVGVPRTGGVAECLADAHRDVFDAVVVDEISRPARDMLASLTLEEELDRAGITYRVAAEPPGMDQGARSTRYILRHTSRMTAAWYRLQMQEFTERGQREHARRGFAHGKPPYGYVDRFVEPDRPLKGGLFERRTPRVLVLDPDERKPAAVAQMFRWRTGEDRPVSLEDITGRLNADPDRFPPPGEVGWRLQTVRALLMNPKYTGYMVYNRKGTRTNGHRYKPYREWVWSAEPVHPAIVPLETWVRAQEVSAKHNRRQQGTGWVQEALGVFGFDPTRVASSKAHTLYEVNGARFAVPRRPVPEPVAEALIESLAGHLWSAGPVRPPAPTPGGATVLVCEAERVGGSWVVRPRPGGPGPTPRRWMS